MLSPETTVQALERAKAMGRIRCYGVSNFGPQNLKDFVNAGGKPATNQVKYLVLYLCLNLAIILV